jgi:hypothetical protein
LFYYIYKFFLLFLASLITWKHSSRLALESKAAFLPDVSFFLFLDC